MSDNAEDARKLILRQISYIVETRTFFENVVLLRNEIWHPAERYFPVILYRYRPNRQYELDALEKDEIYLSRICDFDDQMDTFPLLAPEEIEKVIDSQCVEQNIRMLIEESSPGLTDKEIDRQCSLVLKAFASERYLDFKRQVIETVLQRAGELRKRLRCACFTEAKESEKMWNEYANNGEGFCLEYQLSNCIYECECECDSACDMTLVTSLLPVVYDGQANVYNQSHVLAGYYDGWPFPSGEEHLVKLIMALHKRPQYSQEREWRLLAEDCGGCKGNVFLRIPPSKIILGFRCSNDMRFQLRKIAEKRGIPVEESGMQSD